MCGMMNSSAAMMARVIVPCLFLSAGMRSHAGAPARKEAVSSLIPAHQGVVPQDVKTAPPAEAETPRGATSSLIPPPKSREAVSSLIPPAPRMPEPVASITPRGSAVASALPPPPSAPRPAMPTTVTSVPRSETIPGEAPPPAAPESGAGSAVSGISALEPPKDAPVLPVDPPAPKPALRFADPVLVTEPVEFAHTVPMQPRPSKGPQVAPPEPGIAGRLFPIAAVEAELEDASLAAEVAAILSKQPRRPAAEGDAPRAKIVRIASEQWLLTACEELNALPEEQRAAEFQKVLSRFRQMRAEERRMKRDGER